MEELRAGELEATFHPELGMVGSSLRHRGEELLGQRGGLAKYASAGSSFGIPLLHPWANRLGSWEYGQVKLDGDRCEDGMTAAAQTTACRVGPRRTDPAIRPPREAAIATPPLANPLIPERELLAVCVGRPGDE